MVKLNGIFLAKHTGEFSLVKQSLVKSTSAEKNDLWGGGDVKCCGVHFPQCFWKATFRGKNERGSPEVKLLLNKFLTWDLIVEEYDALFVQDQNNFNRSKSFKSRNFYNWEELKLRCDSRFQRAFTACSCVFKLITLIGSNQGNYFENATTCSKRMRKTLVATQLNIADLRKSRTNKKFFFKQSQVRLTHKLVISK